MKVIIKKDYDAMGKEAAKYFAEVIRNKPNAVLGLATGSTPISTYKELIRLHEEEDLDFSQVTTFNLDEYLGLTGNHDQSYRYFMDTNLFNHVNIKKENTNVLSGVAGNPEAECKEFEEKIKAAGGIDIQLLGAGGNGHIAFNEPGSPENSRTRVVDLTKETIKDNSRFFEKVENVPTQALSMGIETILEAKKIVIIANKESKAKAVAASIEGPVTTDVPASVLQKHSDVIWIIDKGAASLLKNQPPLA